MGPPYGSGTSQSIMGGGEGILYPLIFTTRSTSRVSISSYARGRWLPMSTFFSSITVRVMDDAVTAGARPALDAVSTSAPYLFANAAPIGLRQMFPIQTNSTFRLLKGVRFTAFLRTAYARGHLRSAPGGTSPPGAGPAPPIR